jgi:hypothetical protein
MNKPTSGLRNWDLVLVEWQDAFDASAGWYEWEGYKETEQLVRSVGYYMAGANISGYIVLAATRGGHQVSQVTHIPYGMIKSVTKLHARSKPK